MANTILNFSTIILILLTLLAMLDFQIVSSTNDIDHGIENEEVEYDLGTHVGLRSRFLEVLIIVESARISVNKVFHVRVEFVGL
ncbi:unnamed protein product [Lupinus luteus]|uniref:Transmembrane protein n=1 Tax=Lupinus luteus TaxID=3873 RepID=A0AAV1XZL6_LUPLU